MEKKTPSGNKHVQKTAECINLMVCEVKRSQYNGFTQYQSCLLQLKEHQHHTKSSEHGYVHQNILKALTKIYPNPKTLTGEQRMGLQGLHFSEGRIAC